MIENTSQKSKNIWFGDYIFKEGFEDVLEDFSQLGEHLDFRPVSSQEEIHGIALINFHAVDVIRYNLTMRRKHIPSIHIVTEPTITVPVHHKVYSFLFPGKRIVLGNSESGGAHPQKPCQWNSMEKLSLQNRILRPVIINANKFSWIRGENYSLRRRLIAQNWDIDVYGPGWNQAPLTALRINIIELFRATLVPWRLNLGARNLLTRPRNYFGPVSDKLETISKYRVCLALENSFEMVTEKLTDAWFGGCIPVYVGPNLRELGIPSWSYLQAEPSVDDLQRKVAQALRINHSEYLKKLRVWLESPEFRQIWGHTSTWKRVLESVL